ncbi:MAG: ABC transporter permease [Crocinitomicaceae bacterium]|nr:ABC transporter permease [Crocinitomicaceae bacterium]|tara:strand:+ start:8800 stop:10131 length:1332 start_codon:yes stop_codon:yes gene_type:complete
MSKIGLIIKREYSTRVKKKSFIIMSILGPLLIVGFLAFTVYLNKKDSNSYKILMVDDAHILNGKIRNNSKEKYELFWAPEDKSYEEAQEILKKDKSFDILLYIPSNITYSKTAKCLYKSIPSTAAQKHLTSIINEAIELYKIEINEIDEEAYRSIKTKINLDVIDIGNAENKNIQRKAYVGYVFAFLIYIFIFMYAVQVMKGVIEEKTNRIVEVIISSVKSFHLMMGKIIGIGLVGFTQFIIWITVITFLSISILLSTSTEKNSLNSDVIQENVITGTNPVLANSNEKIDQISQFLLYEIDWSNMFIFFAIYFIGGYLIYGSLMAAIGSAVNEETDTQQFMIPLTIPLIFSLTMIPHVIDNPSSSTAFWLSEIPFTSPLIMMVRIAMGIGEGGVELWEIILSIFLLFTTFVFCTWISGKIYKTGILLYGKKPSYRDIYKWIKS